jgi:alkylation response protein AidB-like acyl-CoA dehydrogenase
VSITYRKEEGTQISRNQRNAAHAEKPRLGNRLLGGATALLKANCSIVLELVAREAVQILGGIGYTRGGRGERIERIWRDVKVKITT